jgi:hypothetical protein
MVSFDAVRPAQPHRARAGRGQRLAHRRRHLGADVVLGIGAARDQAAAGIGRGQHRAGRQVDVVDERVQRLQVHGGEHHRQHLAAAVNDGVGEVDRVLLDHAPEHVVAGDEAPFLDGAAEVRAVAQVHGVQQRHRAAGDVAVQLDQAEVDEAVVAVEDVGQQRRAVGGIAHQVRHAGQVDEDLARALDRLRFVGRGHAGHAAQVFFRRLDGVRAFADAGQDRHHRHRRQCQRHQQHQPPAQAVRPEAAWAKGHGACFSRQNISTLY